MALGPCDECQERPTRYLLSDSETATTTGLCETCFPQFALALAIAVLPAEVILTAVGPVHVAQTEAEQRKPKRRGGRRDPEASESESEPGPEAAPEVEEVAATADDA